MNIAQERKQETGKRKAFYANEREIEKQNHRPYKLMMKHLRLSKGLKPVKKYESWSRLLSANNVLNFDRWAIVDTRVAFVVRRKQCPAN